MGGSVIEIERERDRERGTEGGAYLIHYYPNYANTAAFMPFAFAFVPSALYVQAQMLKWHISFYLYNHFHSIQK